MRKIALRARDGSIHDYALVDDDDYLWLSRWDWRYLPPSRKNKSAYAVASMNGGRSVRMHRFIMDAESHEEVDHRNLNGLDNQRHNLRRCTGSQNMANSAIRASNTSGYKGVSWNKRRDKWSAQIRLSGKKVWLGDFSSADHAARAYDAAARQEWGDFAKTNFGPGGLLDKRDVA